MPVIVFETLSHTLSYSKSGIELIMMVRMENTSEGERGRGSSEQPVKRPMGMPLRVVNVARYPGGPLTQRRFLVPVAQQQQQPREGDPPPLAASQAHALRTSASTASPRMVGGSGTASLNRPHPRMQPRVSPAVSGVRMGTTTPQGMMRRPGVGGVSGGSAVTTVSSSQSPMAAANAAARLQKMVNGTLVRTVSSLATIRKIRSIVRSSYAIGDDMKNEEDAKKKMILMSKADSMIKDLVESLKQIPLDTQSILNGDKLKLIDKMVVDGDDDVIEHLHAIDTTTAHFLSASEALSRVPFVRCKAAVGKEGLQAHAAFLVCLNHVRSSKKMKEVRHLTIQMLNNSPRDTRFELRLSTPLGTAPSPTTTTRCVITVADGCLVRANFLGPNEVVDSQTEDRSSFHVYRMMSANATQILVANAKGRQMSLMSSMNSVFSYLQTYTMCMYTPCAECGKILSGWMPPTRLLTVQPFSCVHEDCQPVFGAQ